MPSNYDIPAPKSTEIIKPDDVIIVDVDYILSDVVSKISFISSVTVF